VVYRTSTLKKEKEVIHLSFPCGEAKRTNNLYLFCVLIRLISSIDGNFDIENLKGFYFLQRKHSRNTNTGYLPYIRGNPSENDLFKGSKIFVN